MELWVATTNQGKLNEFKNLLSGKVTVHSLADLPNYYPPAETGKTFVENARIKAKSLRAVRPGRMGRGR